MEAEAANMIVAQLWGTVIGIGLGALLALLFR